MITTEQFEHKLIEYLDGELSDAEKREVEEYLQAHPEAIDLKGDFSLLCAPGNQSASPPSPQICSWRPTASSPLAWTIRVKSMWLPSPSRPSNGSPEITPSRPLLSNLAAAVPAARTQPPHSPRWRLLLVGAVTQRAALADIASSLLQRIVVTFNDEPLSDSQQQTFDEAC